MSISFPSFLQQRRKIYHFYRNVSGVPSEVKVNTPEIANPIDLQSEEILLEMLDWLEPPGDVREKEKKKTKRVPAT